MQDSDKSAASGKTPLQYDKGVTELVDLFKPSPNNVEDIGTTITALLTSAIHDISPQYTVSQLASAIAQSGVSTHIDALHVVPLLLDSSNGDIDQILDLLGECGNPKEVIISTQEAVERLISRMESEEEDINLVTIPSKQLHRAIRLYTSSIPRAKWQKRLPSTTLRPILDDLRAAISKVSNSLKGEQAMQLLQDTNNMISSLLRWLLNESGYNDGEGVSKGLLRQFLTDISVSLLPLIESNKAQRQFESLFPRFAFRRSARAEYKDAECIIMETIAVANELGITVNTLLNEKSVGSLILLAHNTSLSTISSNTVLESLLPMLISSIQSNTVLSSSLSILLTTFHYLQTSHTDISPDTAIPLSSALTALSSLHPDPQTRHLAFRILSMALSLSPPLTRMQIFREILTDDVFPQIRVAGIGLLKETVLDALSWRRTGDPFPSPALLQTFGPVIFQSNPPDLFLNSSLELDKFLDTVEPKRLVECLSFYYALLMRDQGNITGIRDRNNLSRVSTDLLNPLHGTLERWSSALKTGDSIDDGHALMALSALETALDRVYEAKSKLGL